MFTFLFGGKRTRKRSCSHVELDLVYRSLASCKTEDQVESVEFWIGRLDCKGIFSDEIYRHLKMCVETRIKQIMAEKYHKEVIYPYLKDRADKIVKDDRSKKIKIVAG